MYQPWRKLRPNCISVTKALAEIVEGTGASTSFKLTPNFTSNVNAPFTANAVFSTASRATPPATWTTHGWGYACTQ
jgi:hypothetical protein